MKKITVLIFVAMVSTMGTILADNNTFNNYFTISNSESLRVKPVYLSPNQSFTFPVWAHFEGRLDYWWLEFTFPSSVTVNSVTRKDGMDVPYLQSDGSAAISEPILAYNSDLTTFTSTIMDLGYWDPDNDGIYECYGTVKWGPGETNTMFEVNISFSEDCTGDSITIDGRLNSSYDARDNTVNALFYKCFKIVFGFAPGDVDGNDIVTIHDVSLLVNYLLTDEGLNQYQLVAADFNDDGLVTIDDVTAITNYLLTN